MTIELQSFVNSILDKGQKELTFLCRSQVQHILVSSTTSEDQELISLADLTSKEVIKAFEAQGKDFQKVSIITSDREVTCLPDGLFEEKRSSVYLEQVFGQARASVSLSKHIPALGLTYVFRADEGLANLISKIFPQAEIRHLIDPLIVEAWANQRHDQDFLFRLHQEGDDLFILVFQGKKLMLQSHHFIGDPTDVVYHSLNTINAMGVDHEQATLCCSGHLDGNSEGLKMLQEYCSKAVFKAGRFPNIDATSQFILSSHSFCG